MTNNTMGNGELLVLKDLNVWYTKGKPVLEHFSSESCLAAGKTTSIS